MTTLEDGDLPPSFLGGSDEVVLEWEFSSFMGTTVADFGGILCDSELSREKMWSRIHLIPLLQAEEDRDLVRRTWADKARERELLGKETKVYHSDR